MARHLSWTEPAHTGPVQNPNYFPALQAEGNELGLAQLADRYGQALASVYVQAWLDRYLRHQGTAHVGRRGRRRLHGLSRTSGVTGRSRPSPRCSRR